MNGETSGALCGKGNSGLSFTASAGLFATGFGTFVNLYAPQPMLPSLKEVFGASELLVSLTISAPVLAVALAAPFVGMMADAIGRKRIIVASMLGLAIPTLLCATAVNLTQLVFWRFLQGFFVPGIISVALAYVSEESDGGSVGRNMSRYVAGTIVGGFSGRFLTGLMEPVVGWRLAFLALGLATLAMAFSSWRWLPRSQNFMPHRKVARTVVSMKRHLGNIKLLATYALGFEILFTLVGVFTYVNFYLANPPFSLGPAGLAFIFAVYMVGAVVSPIAGAALDKYGCRKTLAAGVAMSVAGLFVTLAPSLFFVVLGLAVTASGAFACQTVASSQIGKAAGNAKSSAAGLYVCIYYLGGCAGSVAPGFIWSSTGWLGCVILIAALQIAVGTLAFKLWREKGSQSEETSLITPSCRPLPKNYSKYL